MPIKYIPFYPEPIRGQALLDNFKRTLRYSGSDNAERLVKRGMPLYESETLEVHGDDRDSGNLIIRGECLAACAALKDAGRTVDLVYIDPPFASGADYAKSIHIRPIPNATSNATPDESKLESDSEAAFEEKMYGDVWEKEKYLNWMYTNLLAIKAVMSDNASIYVHLDWHIGHYVKILMDEIFGEENFRSEIIWKRSSAHSDNTDYANIHDTIFFYQLGVPIFNTPYIPYSEDYANQYYSKTDERGRFKDTDLSAKGLQGSGYTYTWKGKPGYWRCPISTMERYENEGRIYYTSNGTPRLKQYLDEMPGVPAQDIWTDIFPVNSQAAERVDYATQKPEALLERIIKASSDEGMTVADFFGGSGVAAAVAHKLGRKFIHVDVGVNSIQTARDRLVALDASFDVREIKDGVSLFRNPVQTMDKLKSLIRGLRTSETLGDFWAGAIHDSRIGMVPVYIPNLLDSSSRMLDVPLLFRVVHQAIPALPPEVKKVIVYYIQPDDMDALKSFLREQKKTLVEIELRDLKELLDEVVLNDEASWTLEENASGEMLNPWKLTVTRFYSDRVRQKIDEYNQHGNANPGKNGFTPIKISENGLETLEAIAADCTSKDGPFHATHDLRIDKSGKVILDGQKTGSRWDGTLALPSKPFRLRFRNICGDESIIKI